MKTLGRVAITLVQEQFVHSVSNTKNSLVSSLMSAPFKLGKQLIWNFKSLEYSAIALCLLLKATCETTPKNFPLASLKHLVHSRPTTTSAKE